MIAYIEICTHIKRLHKKISRPVDTLNIYTILINKDIYRLVVYNI
jgi:hypothetical protein